METILRTEVMPIKGTTKLHIGDPSYFEEMEVGSKNPNLKKLTFDGNISSAPIGAMRISQTHNVDESDGFEWDDITVKVYTGHDLQTVAVYSQDKYFPSKVKSEHRLGCDTACFEVATKYGYDVFDTGADGDYGSLIVNKQYYGMILRLTFDPDLFTFDEIKKRMLKLFPLDKKQLKTA